MLITKARKTLQSKKLRKICRYWELYLFLLPPIIYVVVFKYIPMFGAQIAFRKYTIAGGIWNSPWIGIDNFIKFFNSYQFKRILPNTLFLSFYSLVAGFPIPILLALCLNAMRSRRYSRIIQTITYIPYFISTVVLVGMDMQLFNSRAGAYGIITHALTGVYPSDLLGKGSAFPHLYVWSGVWQHMGFNSIIYIAALSSVSPELHEVAEIDGANRIRRIWHIDIPVILPTAIILLILNAGRIMDVGFEKVYLMQNNLNHNASEVISTYVYKVGISEGGGDFSYATAIGLFNSVVNMILLISVNYVSKRVGNQGIW